MINGDVAGDVIIIPTALEKEAVEEVAKMRKKGTLPRTTKFRVKGRPSSTVKDDSGDSLLMALANAAGHPVVVEFMA